VVHYPEFFEESCSHAMEAFGSNALAVMREGTARLLHRETCDVVLALCNMATQSTMLEGPGQPAGSAMDACIAIEGSVDVMLKILANSMTWPDDTACAKAVEASQRLLPRLQGEMDGRFREAFARDISAAPSA